ncbi:uncharacterized protein LOC129967023 [Argiope bruennichi]|uniref:Uncharacterized protein n=1 Tax=Argiope bruennichi TaxID=94029 RepID=A0A8T0EB47_ARGBR|nr:uncharacterized protein LOC129967023 [Argiope bruennichi]KAF8767415.1 hypothetical protein HNY73_020380 [Argiope bruennichi]
MAKPLDLRLKLTLEEMALRRVVVNLWNETDILSSLGQLQFQSLPENQRLREYRMAVNDKIKEKISKFVLPESLKKRMMDTVKPISWNLLSWEIIHKNILNWSNGSLRMPVLEQLSWTSVGTVDHRKTAEKLIHLYIIDDFIRYKLACLHCLVDHIPRLFDELAEHYKTYYVSKFPFSQIKMEMDFYWAFMLNGKEADLKRIAAADLPPDISFNQHAFALSAIYGNKGAAEYFFTQQTADERYTFLYKLAETIILNRSGRSPKWPCDIPTEKISEILCYLLSLMNPEQQMQALKNKPCDMFVCFLDWPWQDVALRIADLIWTFLPESEYCYLLERMNENTARTGYYLPDFYQKFFLDSPSEFKVHFINHECLHCSFFPKFLEAEDIETIRIILRNIDVKDKMKLGSCYNFFRLLDSLLMTDKSHLVKMCLGGVAPSKEDKDILKKTYMKFVTRTDRRRLKQRKCTWNQLFRDIDKTNESTSGKGSSNGKTLTKAKRHRRRRK